MAALFWHHGRYQSTMREVAQHTFRNLHSKHSRKHLCHLSHHGTATLWGLTVRQMLRCDPDIREKREGGDVWCNTNICSVTPPRSQSCFTLGFKRRKKFVNSKAAVTVFAVFSSKWPVTHSLQMSSLHRLGFFCFCPCRSFLIKEFSNAEQTVSRLGVWAD